MVVLYHIINDTLYELLCIFEQKLFKIPSLLAFHPPCVSVWCMWKQQFLYFQIWISKPAIHSESSINEKRTRNYQGTHFFNWHYPGICLSHLHYILISYDRNIMLHEFSIQGIMSGSKVTCHLWNIKFLNLLWISNFLRQAENQR